jgi:hypothetical protein
MHTFIAPTGEKIKTKTIKEFAQKAGMHESHARDLACGFYKRFHGYCSTHRKARKERARFLTVLVNPKLGKREILGQTVKGFAEKHHLCVNELHKLILGRKIVYRGWMLERTQLLAQGAIDVANN